MPDFYREPGIYPNRDYLNQHATEHIDPFSGALQLHFVDIHIPGPAGFDIKLTRSYSSNTFINAAAEPALQSGIGWTMHFGRVLMRGSTNPCINRAIGGTSDNPVLELPDGSRQVFFWTGSTPIWMTAQRWIAHCRGAGTGLTVWSPDGIRYEMTQAVTEVLGASTNSSNYAWYATAIFDRNGNGLTISYTGAQSPRISAVSASDGRSLTFSYTGCTPTGQHVCSVTGPNSTWSYEYRLVPNTTNRYFLTRAIRPDGAAWTYAYNSLVSPSAGSYLLSRVTYPQGGSISYGYTFVNFSNPGNPAGGGAVISSKATSDSGNWTFSYTPGGLGVNDRTVASTPSGQVVYRHVGAGTVASGEVWRIGLLVEKSIASLQTETYVWARGATISAESNVRVGAFPTKIDVGSIVAPVLSSKTVARDGAVYSTSYSNFDVFGNPKQIVEAGPNGGNRTTQLTYFVSSNPWIVRQVDDETTVGVGAVSRTWDSLGRLLSETRDGVASSFAYHATGDVLSRTGPRGPATTSTYSNYLRGIPQTENHPEAVTVIRMVDSAGNVTSETNGEQRAYKYFYDGLNRLTRIEPPLGNLTVFGYPSASQTTVTRGGLITQRLTDGFGRIVSADVGGIVTATRYDALGRRTFQSQPGNPAAGTSYSYDALDRQLVMSHPDGSARRFIYSAAAVTAQDERGYATAYGYRSYGDPAEQYLMSVAPPALSGSLPIGSCYWYYLGAPTSQPCACGAFGGVGYICVKITQSINQANVAIERNGRNLVTRIVQDGSERRFSYNSALGHYLRKV